MRFDVRKAELTDALACADIHISSWIFAYTGLISNKTISAHNAKRPAMWQKMLSGVNNCHYVAVIEDKVIGIITINPPRDTDLSSGTYELTGLYLDPGYIGQGYGKKAINWVKSKIKSMGYDKISLWVLEGNTRAWRFYEKRGFIPDGTSKDSGLDGAIEIRYRMESV